MSSLVISREERTIMLPGAEPDGLSILLASIKGARALEIDETGVWFILIEKKDKLEWIDVRDVLPAASKKKYKKPASLSVVTNIKD